MDTDHKHFYEGGGGEKKKKQEIISLQLDYLTQQETTDLGTQT